MKYFRNTNDTPARLRYLIKEISRRCGKQDDELCNGIGLNVSESNVISSFGKKSEITSSELADNLDISNSRITRIIDGLIEKKLVKRNYSSEDRRIINLTLSEKGIEKSRLLENKFCKCYEGITRKVNNKDLINIIESLEKLLKIMNN